MKVRREVVSLWVLCSALFACKLLKPSPEKLCKKANGALEKAGKTPDASGCVSELTKMKKAEPKKYDCTAKCIQKSDDATIMGSCMSACGGSSSSSTSVASGDDEGGPVDLLTPSKVKDKIESEYNYYGYDIMKESSNSAGWAATVALGKKGATGEVHIYKVVLLDITSHADGNSAVEHLKGSATGATQTRVGKVKALYIECLYQRDSTESGMPKKCSSYDSKIDSFADDIAPYN